MLMCKLHWFMVPPQIRRLVWKTWRARERLETVSTINEHMDAKRQAVDAVHTLLDAAQRRTP